MKYLKHLFLSLLLSYLLFTVCRVVFFVFQYEQFSSFSTSEILYAFVCGLLFDTVPIFYYNILFIALHLLPLPFRSNTKYKTTLFWLFIITNGVALFQNLVDTGYFSFSKKRTGTEIFHLAGESQSLIVSYLIDFWYLLFIFIILLIILIRVYKKISYPSGESQESFRKILPRELFFFVLGICICVVGMRGGLFLKPLSALDAGKFISSGLVPLTTNTPLQLISTVQFKGISEYNFFPENEAKEIIHPIKNFAEGEFQKKNVVIIILESFDKEYIGYFNEGKGYTPFFDSLCAQSLVGEHSYANGATSQDAPPSIFSSIPGLMNESYITSLYNTNRIESIGQKLQNKGYTSGFYHGGKNGTMGFDSYIGISGFGNYFGRNEYPNKKDDDGSWGIPDEPYLQYFAEELNKMKKPFCASVFTLSSHHPYIVPEQYKKTLPKGTLPIHQAVAYSDLSLKKFFETIKTQDWYANTLFVLTADHTSESDNPAYMNPEGDFSVPIIFFTPDGSLQGNITKTIQHTDIYPTVMDILHYPDPFFSLGNSALDKGDEGFAVMYHNSNYQIIQYPWLMQLNAEWKIKLFDLRIDYRNKRRVQNRFIEEKLLHRFKAYLQVYSEGLRKNRLNSNQQ